MNEKEQNKNVTEYILSTLTPIQRYDVLTALQSVTKESGKYNNEEINNYMMNKFKYIYMILNAKEQYMQTLTSLLELRYKLATNIITIEEKSQEIKEDKMILFSEKKSQGIYYTFLIISMIVLFLALPDLFIKLMY
ncbi:hypothetical protein LY90DRAFT_666189 [Neocallimastix californiae]|uniref:Uncharacterized protein n=1 Tax=Neocallimastix californiae TaxID=1754190 RepID=A0A1Y2EV58_9FUNG|nr:hypothetical protein LY90DRAFT_666189 [Neocallimastix californiae]|eukprot:ORY74725.1 hypothetical protein LY90DRAFT_666189 [Neocallimastix californiae]